MAETHIGPLLVDPLVHGLHDSIFVERSDILQMIVKPLQGIENVRIVRVSHDEGGISAIEHFKAVPAEAALQLVLDTLQVHAVRDRFIERPDHTPMAPLTGHFQAAVARRFQG